MADSWVYRRTSTIAYSPFCHIQLNVFPLFFFFQSIRNANILCEFFQHEKALHALANALLEYETLSAEEIKRILLPYREGRLPEQQQEEQQEEGDLVLV